MRSIEFLAFYKSAFMWQSSFYYVSKATLLQNFCSKKYEQTECNSFIFFSSNRLDFVPDDCVLYYFSTLWVWKYSYRNLLSHFIGKNFVKTTFLRIKLLNSSFEKKFLYVHIWKNFVKSPGEVINYI